MIKKKTKKTKITQATVLNFLIPTLIFFITSFILYFLVSSQLFGWDESVYLAQARSWIENTPANQFIVYRPIGMAAVGWFFLHISYSEEVVRYFGVIFGALCITLTYLFFKKLTDKWLALIVTLVIATSSLFFIEAPQFFNDVPSAGLIIGVLLILYIHYKSAGKSSLIYLAPFLAAIAFYIRYGSISTLAVVGLVTAIVLFSKFEKDEDASYSKLIKSLCIFVLLLAPFFIYSYFRLGGFLSILTLSSKAAGNKYLGEGLLNYVQWLPNELGGWALGITSILGIIVTIVLVAKKDLRTKYIGLMWIGIIGLLDFIVKGIFVHAEPRYVFLAVLLLSGVGIAGIYYMIRKYAQKYIMFAVIAILFVVGAYGVTSFESAYSFYQKRNADPYNVAYLDATKAILHDNSNNKNGCVLWSAASRPTFAYYAKCTVLTVTDTDNFRSDSEKYLKQDQYSVVFTKRKTAQLDLKQADNFGVKLTEVYRTNNLSRSFQGDVIVYRIIKK
jgi:4-amino-4-deoxy-L-arabinose transferase-like glycosyltransferase